MEPSGHLYRLMLSLHNSGTHAFKWTKFLQNIFNQTGLYYIFNFKGLIDLIDLLCLMPLLAKFQLCHGDHF